VDAPHLRAYCYLLSDLSSDNTVWIVLHADEARHGPVQHLLRLQTIKDQQEYPRVRNQLRDPLPPHPAAHASLLQHRKGKRLRAPPSQGNILDNDVHHLQSPLHCSNIFPCF